MKVFRSLAGVKWQSYFMGRAKFVAAIAVFGVLGTVLLFHSHASTPTAAFEAENGTVSGCASTAGDASASGGQAVQFGTCGQVTTASSVSQYGITWTFDKAYSVGQFAGGDYWVVGPVKITSITPNAASGLNGWQVNPPLTGNRVSGDLDCVNGDCGGQSFDSAGEYYSASRMPSLPYTANGGESIVKVISRTGHGSDCDGSNPCLQTAAILTVLSSVPPNNGATVFRPPYVGTNKPLFSTASFDTQMGTLPRLASTSAVDSNLTGMTAARDKILRPDIGYHVEEINAFHPVDNVGLTNPYSPGIVGEYTDSILRALVVKSGDDETVRRQIMLAAVQRGIDIYGERAMGMHWYAAGGTNFGTRLPIVVAAYMLNNQTIKDTINNSVRNDFAETGSVWPSSKSGGQPVWGQDRGGETAYWQHVQAADETGTTWDPYFLIDGANAPSTTYQMCCSTAALKGNSLVVHLIPGMQSVWNDDVTLDYVQRWVSHGMLTQPDPCAPLSQGGGPDPNGPGCILDPDLTPGSTMTNFSCQAGKQCGRFPTTDGTHANETAPWWGSTGLMEAAWNAYRSRW